MSYPGCKLRVQPEALGLKGNCMRAREMKHLLAMVDELTANQRDVLLTSLSDGTSSGEWARVVQSKSLGGTPRCPKCRHSRTVRNGQANGLQRYKCRGCTATFNALTGTPLARLRYREQWLAQTQALAQGLSVRKAAQQLGVDPSTAFRWRHRFLALPAERRAEGLAGIVEADETYVLRSCKGQPKRRREQGRAPRKRGGKASTRGMSHEHVPILVVRDRGARTLDYVLDAANKFNVTQLLRDKVASDAVLCTDGSRLLATVAKRLGVQHEPLNVVGGQRVRGPWHIQNVNAYHARLKQWLRRFNGVATSYLSSYTGWFRVLDANARIGLKPTVLLAMAAGVCSDHQ